MTKLDGHMRERLLAPNFWHLATVGPDGAPQVSPMWVDIEAAGDTEHVMVNTSVGRVKEENLRRNPLVSLSHHDPENPYDRAEIRGRVVRFVEGDEALRAMDRLTRKYIGQERYPWLLPGERRLMILIEPVRVRRVVGVEPFRAGVLPQG
ncbi:MULTISPECIES: PPOX class F420-dependent oxidoreductase [Streptomyces]|uniref:PPOX class probable F420-dependent enzyme n=1 Tax=Streptomyces stelliscabiei TaxID=146820 RepID=A0A8I0TUT3_9ACTN|nr:MULTISPECIES: PPOX class F420-dependent oxidoreductase [Streptomyces]KND27098.1 oxidoreductase [Streptomyces stelliscabiei]MBE1600351.1 PPOX class probable F420-dependent enzyme [Streptomyces stelliscabiei]MDX2520389.1 PPOX class F420-dependent oxidoreductase [Streptomyces stelliscabiei]MDX2557144.1 PPOX class F420-dependent oxidoreductase [Streptomyces stelliscabiei]MDX2616318.1 PPOX class F420-dependent oxidoreductase [Streptomyces stelliscabiei]